jgi:hypothetical protein
VVRPSLITYCKLYRAFPNQHEYDAGDADRKQGYNAVDQHIIVDEAIDNKTPNGDPADIDRVGALKYSVILASPLVVPLLVTVAVTSTFSPGPTLRVDIAEVCTTMFDSEVCPNVPPILPAIDWQNC